MSNTLLTPAQITKEALMVLVELLVFTGLVDRQHEGEFAKKGGKIGDTISIRKPPKYTVSDGATYSAQDVTEGSVPLKVDKQKHVDMEFTSAQLALSVEEFSARIIRPAMSALASYVDADLLNMYKDVYSSVGTPGTDPATVATALAAGVKLDNYGCPEIDRNFLLNPSGGAAMVGGLSALFNSQAALAKQFTTGQMGKGVLGFDFFKSQNVKRHTVGALGGTPLVKGASQTGASLITDGWSNSITGVLKQGDIFTIAGCYQVSNPTGSNPQTLKDLQQFVVTADADSNGSGEATLAISPSIITSGAFQTVNAAPANDAALTIVGTAATSYAQNLVFHPSAFTAAFVDLPQPDGVDMYAQESYKGINLRLIRQYDINTDKFKTRLDVMYGYKCQRPELATRHQGN